MAVSRDLQWVVVGRVLTALVTLVAIRYSTSILPPEQYGKLALLTAMQLFCGLFLVNPVGQYINRNTFEWWDAGELLSRLAFYPLYILFVAIVGAAGIALYGAQDGGLPTAAAAIFLMVISASWNGTAVPLLNMLGDRASSAAWSVVSVASGLMVSALLLQFSPTATSWFAGQAIGMAIGAAGAWLTVRRMARAAGHISTRLPLITRGEIYSYCVPLAIATGFMWAQLSGWRFVVEHYWGVVNLGFMAVGLLLASQLWGMIESLVMQFVNPLFYRRVENGESPSLVFSDLVNLQLPSFFLLAGAMIAGSTALLELFVDDQYGSSWKFLVLGAIVECCRVICNVFGNAAQVTRKTRSLTWPYALGASSLFALIATAYASHAGIELVGSALGVAGVVMLVAMTLAMHRQVSFKTDSMRWVLALIGALTLGGLSIAMDAPGGMLDALGRLSFIGLLTIGGIVALLWKNPALQRFHSVKLRVGKGACVSLRGGE